ncbi:MAG TPA: hypothetical protein VFN77_07160, partial [Acetobacteraceae bacterium]|nr:hypothetical protein [Acetobacteraceae bacterium]
GQSVDKRNGTTTLFAALNVPDGTMTSRNMLSKASSPGSPGGVAERQAFCCRADTPFQVLAIRAGCPTCVRNPLSGTRGTGTHGNRSRRQGRRDADGRT